MGRRKAQKKRTEHQACYGWRSPHWGQVRRGTYKGIANWELGMPGRAARQGGEGSPRLWVKQTNEANPGPGWAGPSKASVGDEGRQTVAGSV